MASNRPPTAASAISSAISDDWDNSRPASAVNPLPFESQPAQTPQTYTHLRSYATTRYGTPAGSFGAGSSASNPSRPQSPSSQVSKTHVPSLTAPGFFKPMSSQRLQAQRLGRPNTGRTNPLPPVNLDNSDANTEGRRSMSTIRQTVYPPLPEHDKAPPSRGTEFTDPVMPDRGNNASPVANTTTRSLGDGVRLLNERAEAEKQNKTDSKPKHLTLGQNFKTGVSQTPPKNHRDHFDLNLVSRKKVGNLLVQVISIYHLPLHHRDMTLHNRDLQIHHNRTSKSPR